MVGSGLGHMPYSRAAAPRTRRRLRPMAEQRTPSSPSTTPDPMATGGLSEAELAEAEVEADVTDADLEEYTASTPVAAREPAPSTLSEDELGSRRRRHRRVLKRPGARGRTQPQRARRVA